MLHRRSKCSKIAITPQRRKYTYTSHVRQDLHTPARAWASPLLPSPSRAYAVAVATSLRRRKPQALHKRAGPLRRQVGVVSVPHSEHTWCLFAAPRRGGAPATGAELAPPGPRATRAAPSPEAPLVELPPASSRARRLKPARRAPGTPSPLTALAAPVRGTGMLPSAPAVAAAEASVLEARCPGRPCKEGGRV